MADFEVPALEHSPWPTPSRAIYGFVLYVSTYVIFAAYLLWGLLPDAWLHSIGLTYLPARHWVITFPFLLVALVGVAYVAYVIKLVVNFRAVTDEDIEDIDQLSDEDGCRRREKKTD